MKAVNLIFSALIVTLSALSLYWDGFVQYGFVFLCLFLGLLVILAIDSRSLSYIYFNKKQYKKYIFLIVDFIIKLVCIVLLPWQFFYPALEILIIIITSAIVEIALYFITKKWVGDRGVYDNLPPSPPNTRLSGLVIGSFISLMAAIAFVFSPNYLEALHWLYTIPLTVSSICFVLCMTSIVYKDSGTKRCILYLILFFATLSFFVITKYVFFVKTPISIFTMIGLLFMLPYFVYVSKCIRKANKGEK